MLFFINVLCQIAKASTFLHPVALSREVTPHIPHGIVLGRQRLVIFRNSSNHLVAHSDVCPHQGALFSKSGHINACGQLVCGYHGFKFKDGAFVGLNSTRTHCKHFKLPTWTVVESQGLVFVRKPGQHFKDIHVVPEFGASQFKRIIGSRMIHQHHQTVSENVLDMLHISYVHKGFGNRVEPLPTQVRYEALGNYSGRSSFEYRPRPWSLASLLSKNVSYPRVLVENEFHVPGTTVTRVIVGPFIKTVVTRAMPIGSSSTRLFWEVHRNFFVDPFGLGDTLIRLLMELTLNEDVEILASVDPHHRQGPLQTKYDVTIRKYRQALLVSNESSPTTEHVKL